MDRWADRQTAGKSYIWSWVPHQKIKIQESYHLELDLYFFVFPQKVRESLKRMPVMITYYSNKNLRKSMAIPLLKIT